VVWVKSIYNSFVRILELTSHFERARRKLIGREKHSPIPCYNTCTPSNGPRSYVKNRQLLWNSRVLTYAIPKYKIE
jgi:hypothetical protein